MTKYELDRYPPITPYDCGRLDVSGPHEIYFEQCGNPNGRPVLFVHGGPGGGCTPADRRFFDPEAYRIILFDQRGAGRSTPHACTRVNTTQDLLADMEALRARLGIARWMLFGGSWGSTLSLAYAETYPQHVTAMILRGIFLVRQQEFDWYYRDGTPLVFPDAALEFHGLIPPEERDDLIAAFHRRITGADPEIRRAALAAWARWEAQTSSLHPDAARLEKFGSPDFAEAFAGIELHYFVNRGFFAYDGQLLADADRLAGIPGVIVHGRYDMVCPVTNAFDLHAHWLDSELEIVADAGHDADEPGIRDALIRATDRFGSLGSTKP